MDLNLPAYTPMVLKLAEKYRYEADHSRWVARLATQLFSLAASHLGLPPQAAFLLEHAALLHDIGHFVNAQGHHRHSRYLIEHDLILDRYPEKERRWLAMIAANHRKKVKEENLPPDGAGREWVLKLSALLRVADALDYYRENKVNIVTLKMEKERMVLTVAGTAEERLHQRVSKKADLLEEVFGRTLHLSNG